VQEVASSTQTHAAHARAHASRHAKPQHGSDFAAMLDEMAAEKADTPAEPGTPVSGQAPASEPQPAVKIADAGQPAQNTIPSVPTTLCDAPSSTEPVKIAAVSPEQLPQDAVAQKPAAVLPAAPQTGEQPKDEKTPPAAADKPTPATTVAAPAVNPAPNGATPPVAAPTQPQPVPLPPGQVLQSSDTPASPPGLAIVAPAAHQISAEIKPFKQAQAQAPAQLDPDDQPQASTPEQAAPLLAGGKPAGATPAAEKPDNATQAPHRPALDIASNKSDTAQSIDDLLNQPGAQTDAAQSSGQLASAGNQSGSAAPAAGSNTAAPQSQLGPVPLSGIPVLIASKALDGSNHFDIRLDPPELGRIEVRLKVDRDGQVSSHLIADRADTLALLRRDQTGLERALQDAGLKTNGDGLQFSLRDQGSNGQPNGRSAAPTLLVQDNSNPIPDLLPRGYVSYAARVGGVDIHV
jgi:flagellar hook-length control protein FliK